MATDMFLKLEGIDGDSSDEGHSGEIDVVSMQWGMSQSGTMHIAKGGGAGKVNVDNVHLSKLVDSASPNLIFACCSGKHIPTAVITCRKAGGDAPVEYLKLEMSDVLISSVSVNGSQMDDRVTEGVVLNFGSFKVTFTPQENDGTPMPAIGPMGWDMQKNVKV
jgi:type VI secretion system secreted protein Hcp